MASLEYKTYIACTAQLAKSMAPSASEIAADLAGIGIVPPNIAEKIRSTPSGQASASELVSSVAASISENKDRYQEFVDVLKRYPDMSDTLDLLFDTYDNGGVKIRGTATRPVSRRNTSNMSANRRDAEFKRGDEKSRRTARRLARDAVNSAIRRSRLEEDKYKCMHVLLALVVVVVAVLAGVASFYISGGASRNQAGTPTQDQVCTKIGSPQALGQVLVDTDLPFNSLCKGLDLPDTTCSSLADEAPPLGKLAKKYMEQNPSSCWESIVKALCRKLAKKDLAKIVAKKHGVSDYSTLC